MNYIFTTLAVGKPYFSSGLKFYANLHDRTKFAFLNITTTENDLLKINECIGLTKEEYISKYPRIKITTLEQINPHFKTPLHAVNSTTNLSFQFNYKALSIKAGIKLKENFEFLIYVDSDWSIHESFDETKILNMCSYMNSQEIDFAYERPAKIGNYKKNNLHDCFFIQKVKDYNAVDHIMWDEADVVNEQFLVFKNNWKLKFFSMKWEQFLWYALANDITGYAEGFEIGVSALESRMKMSYNPLGLIKECFYFYGRHNSVEKNIRF
jgi:hypothetical protein